MSRELLIIAGRNINAVKYLKLYFKVSGLSNYYALVICFSFYKQYEFEMT